MWWEKNCALDSMHLIRVDIWKGYIYAGTHECAPYTPVNVLLECKVKWACHTYNEYIYHQRERERESINMEEKRFVGAEAKSVSNLYMRVWDGTPGMYNMWNHVGSLKRTFKVNRTSCQTLAIQSDLKERIQTFASMYVCFHPTYLSHICECLFSRVIHTNKVHTARLLANHMYGSHCVAWLVGRWGWKQLFYSRCYNLS